MRQALLEIADLHLRFSVFEGVSHVLSGVSLRVERGERVALVGESGCGKSVMLRAILGLLDPKRRLIEGRIRFDGADLEPDPDGSRRRILRGRRITMIFQDPSAALNPVFMIGEQLVQVIGRAGRIGRAEAIARAREGLRQVAIEDPDRVLASYPFQLSGGMNQRVMITMALVNTPDLVLADEPGTALDVTVQNQTLRLMRRLTADSGAAVLLITHNLGVVRAFAERVYVMYAGAIVEEAPVEELFRAPRHPYTQALLAAVPRLVGAELPKPIEGMVPDFTKPPEGCRFHPRCPHARARCLMPPPRVEVDAGHAVACVLYGPEDAVAV
jgi:peptide/nickel transport system ATP-binding protein